MERTTGHRSSFVEFNGVDGEGNSFRGLRIAIPRNVDPDPLGVGVRAIMSALEGHRQDMAARGDGGEERPLFLAIIRAGRRRSQAPQRAEAAQHVAQAPPAHAAPESLLPSPQQLGRPASYSSSVPAPAASATPASAPPPYPSSTAQTARALTPPPDTTTSSVQIPAGGQSQEQPPAGRYAFSSPAERGTTHLWSRAGGATQGVAGAQTWRIRDRPATATVSRDASIGVGRYVVFHGIQPGVYATWDETQAQVHRVRNSLHKKYPTSAQARAAYRVALSRDWIRAIRADMQNDAGGITYLPRPIYSVADIANFDFTADTAVNTQEQIEDEKWYLVYKGISPGVYRSYLESQLNVLGISNATHESLTGTIDLAIAHFLQAVEDGDVAELVPPYVE